MPTKRILITGGAGFVGCNAARFFRVRNWGVTVLDNLSRQGTEQNLAWLREGTSFDFEHVDIRDRANVDRVLSERRYDAVLHLALEGLGEVGPRLLGRHRRSHVPSERRVAHVPATRAAARAIPGVGTGSWCRVRLGRVFRCFRGLILGTSGLWVRRG